MRFLAFILSASMDYHVPAALICAVIATESSWNVSATSPAGAKGLMQIMPVIRKKYNVKDPFDAKSNIRAGTAYLASLVKQKGNYTIAVACYNFGPSNNLKKLSQFPKEVQNYTRKVAKYYKYYAAKLKSINNKSKQLYRKKGSKDILCK